MDYYYNETSVDLEVTIDPCSATASPFSDDFRSCFEGRNATQIYVKCSPTSLSNCVNSTGLDNRNYKYPDVRPITVAIYLLTFVFGMTGNTLVIYVIGKYEKIRVRSVSNYYIWNLAFADVLFVVTLPFFCFPTYAATWPFGSFACKLLTVFRECNKFASVLTLVALSIDRFLATFHQFGRFRQIKSGIIACIIIWMICLIISTPYWLYATVITTTNNRYSCLISWPDLSNFSKADFRRLWTYVQLIFGLLVPFAIIATFSILLLRRMHLRTQAAAAAAGKKKRPIDARTDVGQRQPASSGGVAATETAASRQSRRSQANSSMTRVVLVIVVMFGICHLPYHVNEVVAVWIVGRQRTSTSTISALIYFNVVSQILVFIASCSNPIIYGVLNKNYRALYKQSICCCVGTSKSDKPQTAVTRTTNCNLSSENSNADSRKKRRRGTEFFPVDGSPKLIVEAQTLPVGNRPTNGKSEPLQSCVYLDIHDVHDAGPTGFGRRDPATSSGGAVTFLVDNMIPDDKCSL